MLALDPRRLVLLVASIAAVSSAALLPGCVPMGGCADHREAALTVDVSPEAACLEFAPTGDVDTVDACGSSVDVTNACARALTLRGQDNDGQIVEPGERATVYFDTFTGARLVTIPAELGATPITIRIAIDE